MRVAWTLSVFVFASSCGTSTPVEDPHVGQMVYIDTATGTPFAANISRETPAIHPDTGKRTLVPALYCATCKQWYPAPPLEVLQRNPAAGKCPKGHGKLATEGPWPESAGPAR